MNAKPKDDMLESLVNSVLKEVKLLFPFTVWIWFLKKPACCLLPISSKVQTTNQPLSALHETRSLSKARAKSLNNNDVAPALSPFKRHTFEPRPHPSGKHRCPLGAGLPVLQKAGPNMESGAR